MSGTTWCYTTVQKSCSLFASILETKRGVAWLSWALTSWIWRSCRWRRGWCHCHWVMGGHHRALFGTDSGRRRKMGYLCETALTWCSQTLTCSRVSLTWWVRGETWEHPFVAGTQAIQMPGGPCVEWEGSRDVFQWPNIVASSPPCLTKCKWFKIKDNLKPHFLGHTSYVSSKCWVAAMLDGTA